MVPSCMTSKKILTKRAHLGNWTNEYQDISSTTSLHFTGGKFITMTMESWKWKMAVSERELLLEIHPSFTEQNDYGRERVPVVYSISHFFTKHQKKKPLKTPPKKRCLLCPGVLAVSGYLSFSPFFFKKNTADRGT